MPKSEEDDLDALPEGELLTLPGGAIPSGWLTEFFARRAAQIHQQDSNELALELSGDSSLHLMIFRDMDPKEKRRRKEDEDRRSPTFGDGLVRAEQFQYQHDAGIGWYAYEHGIEHKTFEPVPFGRFRFGDGVHDGSPTD